MNPADRGPGAYAWVNAVGAAVAMVVVLLAPFVGKAAPPITAAALMFFGSVSEPEDVNRLVIATERGPVAFTVELAATPQQQARGLQDRRTLATDAGMLFIFDPPRIVSMWMKDTYIPLDMLFIAENAVVIAIAADTTPHSLEVLSPPEPVRGVLELNAGIAARLGIRVGDRVNHPMLTSP